MAEEWRAISGYDGYEISDQGQVRCLRPIGSRNPPKEPRFLKSSTGTNGYLRVKLGLGGPTKSVHRLVAETFIGPPPPGYEVAHGNGDRLDNRLCNLSWKTRRENARDRRLHGTNGRGLTESQVAAIRADYIPGETTQSEVADRHGVTQATVSKLYRQQRWADG